MEGYNVLLNSASSVFNHCFLIAGAPLIQKCVIFGQRDHKPLVLHKAMRVTLS